MRLLLVDDNAMNVELFCEALEADGHEIIVERDGENGLERALTGRFDAIILDIQLPRLDGYAVCQRLREAGKAEPILALSSAAMPEQIARGRRVGFTDYLTKPIKPSALREAIRRLDTAA